ncbi:hypothetical protein R3P38DRAFT_2412653, partial [Favolaschia claudopus]
VCPRDAAPWFASAFSQATAIGLGPHFNALLDAWTRIEVASKFESEHSLPATSRPAEVSRWIEGNRARAPPVKNVTAYATRL